MSGMPPLGPKDYLALSGKFVPHPRFDGAMSEVRSAMRLHGCDDEVPCLTITGPTGVGKSTLRKKLAAEYRGRADGMRIKMAGCPDLVADHVPLLQLDMPPNPTAAGIYREALKAWGDPMWQTGKRENLAHRFDLAVSQHGTVGVLIDEAQRLVDRSGTLAKDEIAESLKDRHRATGCIFILLGLGRLSNILSKDGQIARRWDAEIRFEPYRWLDRNGKPLLEEQADFVGMLAGLQGAYPLPFTPDLDVTGADEQVVDAAALRFLHMSHGRTGIVVKLLKRALRIRIDQGARGPADMALLSEAFERAFRKSDVPMVNPFGPDWSPFDRAGQPVLPPPLDDDYLLLNPEPRRRGRRQDERELNRKLRKG